MGGKLHDTAAEQKVNRHATTVLHALSPQAGQFKNWTRDLLTARLLVPWCYFSSIVVGILTQRGSRSHSPSSRGCVASKPLPLPSPSSLVKSQRFQQTSQNKGSMRHSVRLVEARILSILTSKPCKRRACPFPNRRPISTLCKYIPAAKVHQSFTNWRPPHQIVPLSSPSQSWPFPCAPPSARAVQPVDTC